MLLDLAAKYPVLWTYPHKKTQKLYFSIDNSSATYASAQLDLAASKPFLGSGPADKSLKPHPDYDYWHVIGEALS